jgi:hypothetical protein
MSIGKRQRGALAHRGSRSCVHCSRECRLRVNPISGFCVRSAWARGVGKRPGASMTRPKTIIGTPQPSGGR